MQDVCQQQQQSDTFISSLLNKQITSENGVYCYKQVIERLPDKFNKRAITVNGRKMLSLDTVIELIIDRRPEIIKQFLLSEINKVNLTSNVNLTSIVTSCTSTQSCSSVSSSLTSSDPPREFRNLDAELLKNQKKNKSRSKKKKKKHNDTGGTISSKKEEIASRLEDLTKKYDNRTTMYNDADLSKIKLTCKTKNSIERMKGSAAKRPNFDKSIDSAMKQSDEFIEVYKDIAHCCNIEFSKLLYVHFLKYPKEIMDLVFAIQCSNIRMTNNKEDFNKLRSLKMKKTISKELQLKIKDECGHSNASWKEVAIQTGCLDSNLSEITREVNGLVVKYFGMKKHHEGFIIQMKPLIEALIKTHLHQMHVRREKKLPCGRQQTENQIEEQIELLLPDNVKIKLSMDGRELGSLRTVVVTLQVLNLQTFGTQERTAVFPIAMYVGEEEDVKKYLDNFIEEMVQLSEFGVVIEEDNVDLGFKSRNIVSYSVPLAFYWVSDLKSLSCVSNLRNLLCESDNEELQEFKDGFCTCCGCRRKFSLASLKESMHGLMEERDLEHYIKVPTRNIFICILHMDERITEYLMKMTLTSKDLEGTIKEKLNSLKGFKNFQFKSKKIKEKDAAEEANSIENLKEYSFMFSGTHCKRIFGNLEKLIGFFKDSNKDLYNVWNGWKSIRKWLYLSNDQLNLKSKEDFDNLKKELKEWGKLFDPLRRHAGSVGDYIHIAVHHLHSMLSSIGSLVPLSNQGVENSHSHDRWIMDRGVSRAKMKIGKKKKKANSNEFNPELEDDVLETNNQLLGDKHFSYHQLIPDGGNSTWNDLYLISQIILKKLRVLYLSFNYDDITFKRMECRKGAVQTAFWTRDADNLLKPPKAFRDQMETTSEQSDAGSEIGDFYRVISNPNKTQDMSQSTISSKILKTAEVVTKKRMRELLEKTINKERNDGHMNTFDKSRDEAFIIPSDEEDDEEEQFDDEEEEVDECPYYDEEENNGVENEDVYDEEDEDIVDRLERIDIEQELGLNDVEYDDE